MAAFGYGSAYSYNNQNDMAGPGMGSMGGMASNPRSIVPQSQAKGGIQSAPTTMGISGGGNLGGVYGVNYDANPTKDPGFGINAMDWTKQGPVSDINPYGVNAPAGTLETRAMMTTPSDALGASYGIPRVDVDKMMSTYGAGDLGRYYSQAFDQLAWEKQNNVGNLGAGYYDTKQKEMTDAYEAWIRRMMQGGSYGMGGTTTFGGGY